VAQKEQAQAYCFDLVRENDKDRFLASLFAPEETRAHLHALYAFNIELARIRDVVSELSLGEIRLRWWIDALDGIYSGHTAEHPVIRALAPAIERGNLPKASLGNMIEARRFDLYNDPMPTLNDLEGYLGETSAALIQLSALVLNEERAPGCAQASGLAGVAMGIAGHLRLLPFHRARGQCYVPIDVLSQYGLTPANLLAAQPEHALSEMLRGLRDLAFERLQEARSKNVGRDVFLAFLPAALVEVYLGRLKTLGAASLHHVADVSQMRRQWRLYWCARRKEF
jgi:phytoene synthase